MSRSARHPLFRLAVVAGLVAVVVATWLTVFAAPAGAIDLDLDCKEAPEPTPPTGNMTNFITPDAPADPPTGDPFAPAPPRTTWSNRLFPDADRTSIVQVYGYGGLHWSTYDLGCGPEVGRDPMAVVLTSVANWLMTAPMTVVAVTGELADVAVEPAFLGVFDPLLTGFAGDVQGNLFGVLFPVALCGVGVYVVVRANRADYAETISHAGWALVVVAVSAALLGGPVKMAGWLDGVVSLGAEQVRAATGAANGASGPVAAAHRRVLYESWLIGALGAADSPTAVEYGPELFKATTYSWAEMAAIEATPEVAGPMRAAKQNRFQALAGEIADADPAAYRHLQGKHAGNRVWAAIMATIGSLAACLFIGVAAVMMLAALFVVRVGVLAWPALAIIGVLPTRRHVLTKLWDYVSGAGVNAVVCGFFAGIVSIAVGAILGGDQPRWLTILLLLIVTKVAWNLSRPYRSVSSVVPGFEGGNVKKALGLVTHVGASALGARIGGKAAIDAAVAEHATPPSSPPAPAPSPAEGWSAPPLPPPPAPSGALHAGHSRAVVHQAGGHRDASTNGVIDTELEVDPDGREVHVPVYQRRPEFAG